MTALDQIHPDSEQAPAFGRSRLETVLAILILLESMRALQNWYPTVGLIADGKLTNLGRLIWPGFAAASVFSVFRRPWLVRRSLDPLALITISVLSVSFLWSVDPVKSLYQAIVFSGVVASAWFLSIAYSRREVVVLASNTVTAVCAVNVAAILLGIESGSGQTTGFFEHKNILGLAAAVGVLLSVARLTSGERRFDARLALFLAAVALFLSGSRTSQFGTLVVVMFVTFIAVRRRSQPAAFALAPPMVVLLVLALRATGGVSSLLVASGKSSDLTGRTEIWAKVTSLIAERPVVGWGYLAYWRDEGFAGGGQSGFEEFGLRSAHSGYLETALGAGIIGGTLVAILLISFIVRGYRGSSVPSPTSSAVALACIALFTAVVNVSETLFPATTRTLLTLLLLTLSAGPRMRESSG